MAIAIPYRLVAGMALDRQIARLVRILVDTKKMSFDEAQARLRALTLEIVVGPDAVSVAAHAAVLTAVSVGRRTFVGGVRVTGALDQRLNSSLPLSATSLGEAVTVIGAAEFQMAPSRRIVVGAGAISTDVWSAAVWCDGWRAGLAETTTAEWGIGDNPLAGIAAGALGVARAFDCERGICPGLKTEVDLWPTTSARGQAPFFGDVFLPGALWLIGLGNLGQAFLWALSALPYDDPSSVSVVLQDCDRVTEENWATSVLVRDEVYGWLKTKVGEAWATARGFDVRRLDRRLLAGDRLDDDDPRIALSGVDKIAARRLMATVGFDCIVDSGLGRSAINFDRYRVTVFDHNRSIDEHFADQQDATAQEGVPEEEAYQRLEAEIGRCGTAEIAGASVAAPYVSAVAAAVAVSRLIAVASDCECPSNEVGTISKLNSRRLGPAVRIQARGVQHAGRPRIEKR